MTKSRGILEPYKHWSQGDIHKLTLWYPNVSTAEIAQRLGFSLSRVYCKAHKLGLKKSINYMARQMDKCREEIAGLGEDTRFKPGLTPWNKGLKGMGGGGAETQFKKGEISGRAREIMKPIGAERISVEGYLERKIDDTPGLQWNRQWERVHKILWESAHGPVPKGYVIVFKNGDKTDIRLENLECISRVELMGRNTYHNYGKEVAELIQLRGAISRKINKLEGKK